MVRVMLLVVLFLLTGFVAGCHQPLAPPNTGDLHTCLVKYEAAMKAMDEVVFNAAHPGQGAQALSYDDLASWQRAKECWKSNLTINGGIR